MRWFYNDYPIEPNKQKVRARRFPSASRDGLHWKPWITLEDSPISQYFILRSLQGKDGRLHIVYTWRRQRIKYVEIKRSNEENNFTTDMAIASDGFAQIETSVAGFYQLSGSRRIVYNFNQGWRFHRGDAAGADAKTLMTVVGRLLCSVHCTTGTYRGEWLPQLSGHRLVSQAFHRPKRYGGQERLVHFKRPSWANRAFMSTVDW